MASRTLRRALVLFASLTLLVSVVVPVSGAGSAAASRFTATALKPSGLILGDFSKAAQKDGRIAVIVALANAPVASYEGGLKGLPATSPATRHAKSIDFKSQATKDYQGYLKAQRDKFVANVAREVKSAKLGQSFDIAFNGFAARVPKDDVAALAAVPGVAAVYPDVILKPDTDRSPQFIGAPTVWTSLGGQESSGEGVIVGVLDTGIWPEHPSFSDPDPSGKAYAAPPAPPSGVRSCQFSGGSHPGAAFTCNNKLIGATRKMATYDAFGPALDPGEFTSARDDDGHGSHTSSTAAGNAGVSASIFGVDRGIISGIAPRAYVEMFKVCGKGGCFSSDSVSAINEALLDGVNVINFSISGGANAFSDAVEVAFRGAYDAGAFVAASAGNSGPGADTTDHRGPWVTTVAASTADRAFVNQVQLTGDGGASLNLDGISLTAGVGPAPVVVATDTICGPTAAGTYTGKIVVCQRGGGTPALGRAEKGLNVFNAGGVGMILYNQSAVVTDLETDNHYLPASHIQFSQGQTLLTFLGAHTGVAATITAGVRGSQQGDAMASFSSRGGPGQTLGVSKPDITAPGVQILAAASPEHIGVAGAQGQLFQAIAGTSMSSPHIAGSGALLKAVHPNWTPGQIKSALMTTAKQEGVVKEDGSTPANAFDDGSGRVDLTVAGDPGLTFDATGADYVANQTQLYRANYPSIYVPSMPGVVSLTRTAKNTLGFDTSWDVTASVSGGFSIGVPNTITVAAGASTTFNITLNAVSVPQGATRFGMITLKQRNSGGGVKRVLHLPVTIVRGQGAVGFTKTCDDASLAIGDTTHCALDFTNAGFSDVDVSVSDTLPSSLRLDASSVVGATPSGNSLSASFTIAGSDPPDVSISAIPPYIGGYLPLSLFGIPPTGGMADETAANFNVPGFSFGGEIWNRIGVTSDGYVVVGGTNGNADIQFINQNLPNPTRPNNVLAPWWTDLNFAFGGALRVATLTDGVDTWIVIDFAAVREYSLARTDTFEIWIGTTSGDPNEDITFQYGTLQGNGEGGFLTVGAENKFGNRGQNYYVNGSGALPTTGTELRVTSVAGSVSTSQITFDAIARTRGDWTNCAFMSASNFDGLSSACFSGTNTK
jgi:hypothetical protein